MSTVRIYISSYFCFLLRSKVIKIVCDLYFDPIIISSIHADSVIIHSDYISDVSLVSMLLSLWWYLLILISDQSVVHRDLDLFLHGILDPCSWHPRSLLVASAILARGILDLCSPLLVIVCHLNLAIFLGSGTKTPLPLCMSQTVLSMFSVLHLKLILEHVYFTHLLRRASV